MSRPFGEEPCREVWSLYTTHLHTLTVRLLDADEELNDAIEIRFGLRWLGVEVRARN